MGFVVLSDFDGTIVTIDTLEYALQRLADGDWKAVENQFTLGNITLEECLAKQIAMLKVPESKLIDELAPITFLRPNFTSFLDFCESEKIPLTIVSAGLDFYIRRFLKSQKLLDHVSLCIPRIEFTALGLKATFPELNEKGSVNFKDNQVRHYRRLGEKIIFFGNGSGDYQAAKIADYTFAIKGSVLADMCRKTKVACQEITDFQVATETVKRIVDA